MNIRKQFVTYMKEEEYIQKLLGTPEEETKKILDKYRREFISSTLRYLPMELNKYKKEEKEWNKEAKERSFKIVEKLNFIRKICKEDKNILNYCLSIGVALHFYESKLRKQNNNHKESE